MDVKVLFMDVDGTLTDGKIYMGADGEVCKAFNIKDGYGIHDILIPMGIVPAIITGRSSEIVIKRCAELGIFEVHQGVRDKTDKMKEVLEKRGLFLRNAAYIGDDINDIPCMKIIKLAGGVVGCPFDAAEEIKNISDYISSYKGGEGAVRDFIEWIVKG